MCIRSHRDRRLDRNGRFLRASTSAGFCGQVKYSLPPEHGFDENALRTALIEVKVTPRCV